MRTSQTHLSNFACLVILLILFSCKKYEDGPTVSLATKKARLTNKWKLEKVFRDGVELPLTEQDRNDVTEFTKSDKIKFTDPDNPSDNAEGIWTFYDHKKELVIIFGSFAQTYIIMRLASKELRWKYNDLVDGRLYEERYIPQ